MGGNSSRASVRQDRSSANYANGGDGANGASRLPQMTEPLYAGPIHTLCRVGDDSLLSGGVDKVAKFLLIALDYFARFTILVYCVTACGVCALH